MAEKLKETLFPRQTLEELAVSIKKFYPSFNEQDFLSEVFNGCWNELELKQRISHVTLCLQRHLPSNYSEALSIMETICENYRGIIALSFSEYVEKFGTDDWDRSMKALAVFTQSGTSEFAIRPFLHREPEKGIKQLQEWCSHENEHVRRLASEGCRPRLPWGMALSKFKKDPSPILPILEILKDDPSEFVRRSVANNLNDISKDHPEKVLCLCETWKGKSLEVDRIIKHACRSLLKNGNKQAMMLFGFSDPANIKVIQFESSNNRINIGQSLQLSLTIEVNEKKSTKIRLEYVVHYVKANGKTSPKVFQIIEKTYKQGLHTMTKKHDFSDQSTRKHYRGVHQIDLIINGEKKAELIIQLSS